MKKLIGFLKKEFSTLGPIEKFAVRIIIFMVPLGALVIILDSIFLK